MSSLTKDQALRKEAFICALQMASQQKKTYSEDEMFELTDRFYRYLRSS